MHSQAKTAHFQDCVFDVFPNVYEPAEDSFLFAENLPQTGGKTVLDIGTGSGILSVLAARNAQHITAIDINPYAVRCAKYNAYKNQVQHKIALIQGDLFAPLCKAAKFDFVFFNSPYVPCEENEDSSWLARAWAGGLTGRQVIDRFIDQVCAHVGFAGAVYLLQSNLSGVEQSISRFAVCGMRGEVVAELSLPFFERLVLLKATF